MTQYSLLLTMVSLLEEAVNTLCRLYHNINHLDKEVKDIKGSGLERAAKYLKDVRQITKPLILIDFKSRRLFCVLWYCLHSHLDKVAKSMRKEDASISQ